MDLLIDDPAATYYIIGNGFDLAHNVPSSYACFRKWLSVHDPRLKEAIEYTHIATADSLWWDFENSLGNIDYHRILRDVNVAMENFGMPNEKRNPHRFHEALKFATGDLDYIKRMLPTAFRKWVNTLEWGSEDKPFEELINPASAFMNFNYTEFLSSEYGVSRDKIFYPHGCRKEDNEIILGHAPGANDRKLRAERNINWAIDHQEWSHAQGEAIAKIRSFKLHTTKSSVMIVAENQRWFAEKAGIHNFVVIGHSLSKVDYLYFQELIERNKDIQSTRWYITFYEPEKATYKSKGMSRINIFRKAMGLEKNQISSSLEKR